MNSVNLEEKGRLPSTGCASDYFDASVICLVGMILDPNLMLNCGQNQTKPFCTENKREKYAELRDIQCLRVGVLDYRK